MSKASEWTAMGKGKPPTWNGSAFYACVAASGHMRFGTTQTPFYMSPDEALAWARWILDTFGEAP